MRTPMLVVLAGLPWMMVAGGMAQQTQGSAASPNAASGASLVNPVKPTPESLARARKIYGYDCAMCHGADGDGKGDLAVDMKLKLLDYRDPASLKDKADDELFRIIQKGKGDMPPEGDRAKTDGIWNLVNYVRSFAKKDDTSKDK